MCKNVDHETCLYGLRNESACSDFDCIRGVLIPVVTMLPALKQIFDYHIFEGYRQVETTAKHG